MRLRGLEGLFLILLFLLLPLLFLLLLLHLFPLLLLPQPPLPPAPPLQAPWTTPGEGKQTWQQVCGGRSRLLSVWSGLHSRGLRRNLSGFEPDPEPQRVDLDPSPASCLLGRKKGENLQKTFFFPHLIINTASNFTVSETGMWNRRYKTTLEMLSLSA